MRDPLAFIPSGRRLEPVVTEPDELAALMAMTKIPHELAQRLAGLAAPLEAYTLVSALPLVMVAWSDGAVDPAEAERVVEFCERRGLRREGEGRKVLERWLHHGPTARDHALLADFVTAYVHGASAVHYDRWRRAVLDAARTVAEAAGGFLFLISPVNSSERAALARVEALLDPARYVEPPPGR